MYCYDVLLKLSDKDLKYYEKILNIKDINALSNEDWIDFDIQINDEKIIFEHEVTNGNTMKFAAYSGAEQYWLEFSVYDVLDNVVAEIQTDNILGDYELEDECGIQYVLHVI